MRHGGDGNTIIHVCLGHTAGPQAAPSLSETDACRAAKADARLLRLNPCRSGVPDRAAPLFPRHAARLIPEWAADARAIERCHGSIERRPRERRQACGEAGCSSFPPTTISP